MIDKCVTEMFLFRETKNIAFYGNYKEKTNSRECIGENLTSFPSVPHVFLTPSEIFPKQDPKR